MKTKPVNFTLTQWHVQTLERISKKQGKNRSEYLRELIELEDRIDKREQIMQENNQYNKNNTQNIENLQDSSFNATKTLSKEAQNND